MLPSFTRNLLRSRSSNSWSTPAGETFATQGVTGLAAIVFSFGGVLPWIGLEGQKGSLKKLVVHHIAFAVLAAHNPLALLYMPESHVGGDGLRFLALRCVYE
jgi:hypothetical protein